MRSLLVLCVVCALSAHTRADAPDAKAEAAAGQKLYEDGQYHDAAVKFAHAYELDPQVAYLFDAGQAFRFAKECASSAKYYRQFLDAAKQAQVQNVDKVKKYLAEMDLCTKARTQTLEPTPKPEPHVVEPAPPPQPVQQPAPPPETPVSDPGSGKRKAGLALGAVGLVGIAVGAVYTGKVLSDQLDCMAHPCTLAQIKQANDEGPTHQHIELASYAVGGAALAGGIVLYMLGRRAASEHGVTLAPTRHGAVLSFTF
jgi:hypothetical protein